MGTSVKTAGLSGTGGRVLEVTALAGPGPPGLEQRGTAGPGLGPRAEQIWAAVTASGLPWPGSKVTVTVTPDWLPRHDSAADLAIAVAVLAAGGTVEAHAAAGVMYYAGLDTSGSLLPVPGVL
jgi:magnesium chelatase family protein